MSSDLRGQAEQGSEAELRKARSIQRLHDAEIPVLDSLPAIIPSNESVRRTVSEVSTRALALATVAVKGEASEFERPASVRGFVEGLIDDFQLETAFSPAEQSFIDAEELNSHDRIQFTWRYESYWTLLWALGFVTELDQPASRCDPAAAIRIMQEYGPQSFRNTAELRPQSELLDEADLIYRYDWAVVSARHRGETVEGLNAGVVVERHHALNWLIGNGRQEWDAVSSET